MAASASRSAHTAASQPVPHVRTNDGRDGRKALSSSAPSASPRVGNYQLGDCLGRGAFGSVFRGLNWTTGETVAVKQVRLGNIPKSELREITAEIDLLKNLKHANIVKYKGSEKTREYLFIILEYCENGSLQHICKRFGKFPEGLVAVYISQVLEGLVYLHEQGVIHRDIKGANILTNKDGSVKLADFGVATKAGSLLANNAVVGSPYWMAPEVIDQSGATTSSDIWSVGCVVIELLEGKPPYHYLDPMPALFRIVQDDCPPIPDGASPIVKDFLLHCFQKDANLRISAKKLSRHPWMLSARRQLEQMRNGGSVRGHAEAVKSVKEWNEAIKDPAKPANNSAREAKTTAYLPHRARPEQAGALIQEKTSMPRQDKTRPAARDREKAAETLAKLTERPPLATSLVSENGKLKELQVLPERETDNWDDDFEEGISSKKLAALERSPGFGEEDNEDDFATIRPPTTGALQQKPKGGASMPVLSESDDYSDLIADDERSQLNERISQLRQQQTAAADKRILHPNDLVQTLDTISPMHGVAGPGTTGAHISRRTSGTTPQRGLHDYSEKEDEEDYSDLMISQESTGNFLKLAQRHSSNTWLGEDDAEDDPFLELEEDGLHASADLEANIARDKHARMCAHTIDLFHRLTINTSEDLLIETCDELELILTEQSEMKAQALAAHGALTVIELLEAIQIRDVVCRLLGLLNVIIYQDLQAQENLCLIGAIPVVMPFCSKKYPHHVRIEAAYFIFTMCSTSTLTLQFVLSCRGLKTLVELVDEDYTQQKDLVWLGVACVNGVLEMQSPASRNDFCRMLAKEGLLEPLSSALLCVLHDENEDDHAASAKTHILQTLLIYSASESWLKQQVAGRSVLRRLLQACRELDQSSLTQLLKVLKNLTMSPTLLDEIENCNAIEVLVGILVERHDGVHGTEISNQVLNAIYNLCRLNVRRQEEAAQAGLVPHLVRIATTSSPLKQFALPILCDMAHASKSTRKALSQQCGIGFFLDLLQDANWQLQSLESICVWLQGDLARIEDHLLRPHSIQALLYVFVSSKSASLENLLETFLRIFKLSSGITLALGKQSLFLKRLADRMQSSTHAVVRLNLLRMCKAICDVHPDLHALIRQFGLAEIVQKLAEDDGAVLVRELAREIVAQVQRPSTTPSLVAKDAHRTVRRAASETNVFLPGSRSNSPRTNWTVNAGKQHSEGPLLTRKLSHSRFTPLSPTPLPLKSASNAVRSTRQARSTETDSER